MKIVPQKQTVVFLISAAITGLIYLCIEFIAFTILKMNTGISVLIAYVSAMIFYFIINKMFVFKRKTKGVADHYSQIGVFSITVIINFLITLFLVDGFKKFTGEIYSGAVVAGVVTTITAYFVFNRIFK